MVGGVPPSHTIVLFFVGEGALSLQTAQNFAAVVSKLALFIVLFFKRRKTLTFSYFYTSFCSVGFV
jgi:hypothetical protein